MHTHQAGCCVAAARARAPEVGLLRLLLEVEADQAAAQEERDAGAADGVDDKRGEQRRVDAVQDLAEGHEVDHRVQQRHAEAQRGLRELPAPARPPRLSAALCKAHGMRQHACARALRAGAAAGKWHLTR